MSDEKKYTERDLVLAKREGARTAARYLRSRGYLTPGCEVKVGEDPIGEVERHVVKFAFPLPKVTRKQPRIVRRGSSDYKYEKAFVYCRPMDCPEAWVRFGDGVGGCISPTPDSSDFLRFVADLIDNPTEEVEVEDTNE